MRSIRKLFVVFFFLGVVVPCHATESDFEAKRPIEIGATFIGGQLRWNIHRYALELRYLQDSANTDDGKLTSHVVSARSYRFWNAINHFVPFFGLELGSTRTSGDAPTLKTKGYVAGGFVGCEYRISRRISFGLDAGPYVVSAKGNQSHTSRSNLDFVLNSYLNFGL